ncbi:hypothetical protein PSE10A_55520 [Pseudomonas amygdali pv. eriobotryae]|uniref:Uncharacterized protein n=1 Tax=Pseudomonas amygdali pv. eriobotryae TaxID=129137 RepID=A0A9P3AK85_PSEA0|nr:hypothetical protein PSE10A_55520 [Pseudomonas amygdali pv. eriobotryae]
MRQVYANYPPGELADPPDAMKAIGRGGALGRFRAFRLGTKQDTPGGFTRGMSLGMRKVEQWGMTRAARKVLKLAIKLDSMKEN